MRSTEVPPSLIEKIQPYVLNVANAPIRGSRDARIARIEYSDFQRPFCRQHADVVYPELLRQFVETGRIKYVFRNFPIEQLHPSAMKAAKAAECAGEQGKGRERHDQLFANQHALTVSDLNRYAQLLGVDRRRFESCLAEGKMTVRVREDFVEGSDLEARGLRPGTGKKAHEGRLRQEDPRLSTCHAQEEANGPFCFQAGWLPDVPYRRHPRKCPTAA